MSETGEGLQLPLVWVGTDETPVLAANQVLAQIVGPEEFVFTFGHVTPPALVGTSEEQMNQAQQLSYVPVRIVARVAMTKSRLEELRDVINATLDNYAKMIPDE